MSEAPVVRRETCRCCHSRNIELSVPLAQVPIVSPNVGDADRDMTRCVAPLDMFLCRDCGLIQLVHVVDPSLIYRNYLYRTAVSKGMIAHFRELSDTAITRLGLSPGDCVVEFGSNDGTLLSQFRDAGMKVQGIDPARQIAEEATANGIPTLAEFFDPATAQAVIASQGHADLIVSNNVMANIDDLDPIIEGIKTLMADDGAYVFETQYALDVFEKTLLDVIYHEHISCFSVQPVERMFETYGLEVFDAQRIDTKGGSIRFWIQHAGGPHDRSPNVQSLIERENSAGLYDPAYHTHFSDRVASIKAGIHDEIEKAHLRGGKVAIWGTSVGCAALVHQFELEDRVELFLDDTPFKDRLEGPGYELPVFRGADGYDKDIDLIIVLAWRYADIIISNHPAYVERGTTFLVPLPDISKLPSD